jgi:hypothetical protein
MSNPHPITPPDKQLVRKWIEDWAGGQMKGPVTEDQLIVATQAAQWGADMELEACCEWTREYFGWNRSIQDADQLRSARRPQPPSLKEQALEQLDEISNCFRISHGGPIVCDKIRKALEELPND